MVRKRGKTTQKKAARIKTAVSSTKKKTKLKVVSKTSRKNSKKPVKKKRVLPKLISKPRIEEEIHKPPHALEEEIYMPSPMHRGKYRIPIGIKFLIGYLIFLTTLYLISFIYGITFPTTILFGKLITGTRAMVINIVLLGIIFTMLYGFWKRKSYSFDLAIGFFSFTALNAVISLMMFDSAEHPAFKKLLFLSFISLIFMNIVIIWYVLHEKKYFFASRFKDRPVQHRDRVFLYVMVTFWVVVLLIGATLGVTFYKDTTRLIDESVAEIGGDYYMGQLICETKEGPEKDVCTLVIATAMSEYERSEAELTGLCDTIQSDFYRFTCMRSISE